jgi:hypothetical protein
METPDPYIQPVRSSYGKSDAFDLEPGMAVYGPNAQKIGNVTKIAGFGATQSGDPASPGVGERVTQAQSGTGYFHVNRQEVMGAEATDLCVPFHGIQEISPDGGVVLNGAMIAEMRQQADQTAPDIAPVPTTQRGGWRRWLPGKRP